MEEELLKEYVSTYLNPKYNSDWDVVNSKFPELSGVDKGLLKEYVATYLNPKYNSDWDVVNSKFPELFPAGQTAAEQPIAEQQKKNRSSVSPFVDGGSELTKFDPRTGQVVQETPAFTKPKERDFSGLEVKVQDEKILTKQPRVERPIVSSESTKTDPDQIDFDGKLAKQKVSAPMSYSNIFAKTIADLPSDLAETWSVASAFIERQLGKAGVPGANPNLTAKDIYFYNVSDDWRKYTDEVFPTNQEDRSTFLGGVVSGLGQAVPMVMSGGISAVSKGKAAMDIAKAALSTGTKLTPFIKMGKDLAKQAASPSGLIGGSQMSSSMYRQAIDSGATEDQAQQYAIENFFVGTVVESLPIQSMFSRILKKEPTANILRILKEGGVGAGEEFTTEMWQATYENWSAQRIYDFNREMLDGVGEAGAVGGTVGFILNTALAALVGRRARVKTKEEEVILDKSIDEVKSKINTVNTNNENISSVAEELDSIEPIVLNYGDSKYFFARDKSGRMELADEPMLEDQAKSMSNMLGKVYKGLEFSIEEVASNDPYTPVKYNVIAKEKINEQQNAIQEQAAGQVPVQPGATVSQEVEQGVPQVEPQVTAEAGVQEEINEEDIALSGLSDGFRAVTRNSFDVRSDKEVMDNITKRKSFATSVTKNGKKYVVVGLRLNEDVGATTSGRDGYSFATIEDNGNLPANTVDVLTQKAISNISSVYPNIKNPTVDLFRPIEVQEVSPTQQPEIDAIEAQRKQALEANKGGLNKPYYLGDTEGPTLGEFINQEYDAKINALRAKATTPQVQEVTPQQVEKQRKDLDMEVKALEDLLSDPNEEPLFKKSDNDTKFGESADVVEDVVRQMNDLPSGNVTTTITPKPQKPIDIADLESRADVPVKRTTFDVIKGIPAVFSISDQLRIGNVTNPNTGNVIDRLFGGLGFGFTKGHEGFAWANTTKDEAQNLVNRAVSVYNNNKALFDDWWAKNPEYNGLVPLNIAKMAEGSIMSNEALYRVIKDNFASFPKKNKVDALNYLTNNRIPSIIDSLNKSLKNPNLAKNARKSVEKRIKALTSIQTKIKDGKLKSVDQLLDPEFYGSLSLPVRAELISQLTIGTPNKPGEQKASGLPGKNTVPRALLGIDQEASVSAKSIGQANLNKVSLSNAAEIITEPAMKDIEPRQIIAIYGIDVLNPGVKDTVHPNYKFGVNGRPIGVLENSVSIQEAYPFAYTNILESLIAQEEKSGEELKAAPIDSLINEKIPVGIGLPNLEFIGAISQGVMSNAQKLSAWINKSFPSVIMSTDAETFANVLKSDGVRVQLKGDEVVYGVTVDGDIYINPDVHNSDSALFNTTIHEFGHVWLNFLETTAEGKSLLNRGINLVKKTGEYQDQLKKFNGNQTKAANEALAILIGNRGETIVNASLKSKFQEWLLGVWKYVKDKFKLSGDLTPQEIQDLTLDQFLGTAIADLFSGKALPVGEIQLKKLKNPEAAFSKSDSIDSIVQKGRANGFSEESIKIVLDKRGFTEQAINEALGKQTPAAKKVEVTEKLPANYERMIGQLEGVIEKSLKKRGTSQETAMQNAINYLQGTKVYEEATDVQREAMFRDVRKRFKKREKSAPTAKRVLGQKKDVVTITVDLAKERDRIIKEQIKQAKEITGDLNDKRAALANSIRLFEDGGVITTAQTKTIVNRISKVNLNNPIMVDRLLAYIEKVFDNANYAADMTELRKLQRQARTKRHTSMKDFVDRFTYINPEIIPLDRIQDYKEALDFLNNLTPSYARMNEMLPEIESYQVSEEFDAAKTMDSLMSKYENIALNQVGSVEDYVNLIKDINSFKRKAFQLLQNEAIIQKDYDDLINMVGKDQAAVEKRYEKEIAQRKKDLIAEIKKQRPKTNPEFTKEENDLIREYLELSDADLQSLSPEDLFVLNDLLENVSNGEIDYYRFKNVVSKAANNKAGVEVGKQLKGSKLSLGSAELRKKMAQFESSFWEGLLGLGRATSGPLQKFIISPFNRAIGSYEKFIREGFNDFLKLKKKYKIDDKGMNKIGMLTTYLQEYMAQFDPKNKGVKDIGKRDWFKEILATETMRDDYSPEELKIIEEIHKSLPKDNDGNVNPKAVYDSYISNDGNFFNKNEKDFFDAILEWKKNNSTSKQKAANEMSGNAFKEIPFHMLRSRYSGQTSQITPSTSGDNGMVRIKAGTGKERISEAVGAINTDFEKLFIKGLEQTGRDYFLSKTLKDINNVLASAKKELNGDKDPLVKAISYTLSDALAYEFSDTASQNILKRLVQARAAMTLFDPIRAGVEFTSTLLSFGLRARTLSGYKNLFGSQGEMKNLLEFTDSPLRLRQNINNAIDINDGRIEPQGMLMKWTTFLSGLPERTMMVTSWMPTFTSEFQNITKEKFDMKKFNDSEAYREKYGKAIKEASAVADAQTEKIIGPTTKAGQRRDIVIAPGKTVGRDTVSGQILGFFSNYPYREITEFVNGFREAGEVLKKGDTVEAISQLQKPLGIALNVATYGFLSSVVYASRLILLGDEDEEERGNKLLEELMTAKGFIEETAANAAALAASKYAGGGRAILQVLGTLGMMLTDNEETKATIKKMLKGSVYVDPLPTQKLSGYGTADKVNTAILKYIPQFVVLSNIIIDTIGLGNELKAIIDTVEKKGVEALTEDEKLKVLALSVVFTGTQLLLNYRGTSLPSYNNLKAGMKKVKEEAGVADISAGKVPAKKKSSGGGSSRGGGMNKTDMKKYKPELYNQMYGPGSAGYEVEQQVKEFEKEQREFKKKMKDQIYGGKD